MKVTFKSIDLSQVKPELITSKLLSLFPNVSGWSYSAQELTLEFSDVAAEKLVNDVVEDVKYRLLSAYPTAKLKSVLLKEVIEWVK